VVVSDARREANRRNAGKSTGPKSEEGKARAGQNARTHGLTAVKGAVGAEEDAIREARVAAFRDQFRPRDDWQDFLVDQVAGVSLRLGRIERVEARLREVAAWRAENLWDEDRRLEAEKVGANLERDPAKVVATLRRSPQGCDWLIERWAALARVADASGGRGWTEDHARTALDLMGTPESSRVGPIGALIDEKGQTRGPAALARGQVAELQSLRELVAEADEVDRALVEAGLSDVPSREVANLRRYERAAQRQLYWLSAQMKEAGLRPQPAVDRKAPPTNPELSAPPRAERTSIVSQTLEKSPQEAHEGSKERNEPISTGEDDQTNPLRVELEVKGTSEAAPVPPKKRPDLDKFLRRERQNHRDRRSA